MPEERRVNYQFKLLYAVGITFVVLYHIPSNATIELFSSYFPVYSYHLALFAFASGYFYRDESEEHLGRFFARKSRKLLLPFFVWNCIYGLAVVPLMREAGLLLGEEATWESLFVEPFTDGHGFVYNMGSWFVLPLFAVQVYVALVRRLLRILRIRCEYVICILFLAQGIWGNSLAMAGLNKDWWLFLARCHYLLPFFALGRLYNQKLEKHDRLPSPVYFALVFAAAIAVIVNYGGTVTCTPAWCNDFRDPFIPVITGVIGVAFWLRVTRKLECLAHSRWVRLVADHSFDIMMHQFIGFTALKALLMWLSQMGVPNISFNLESFRHSIWYYCMPFGLTHFGLLYLAAGVGIPVLIGLLTGWIAGLPAALVRRLPRRRNARQSAQG